MYLKKYCGAIILFTALLPAANADVITFDFTGRLVVADPTGGILINNGSSYTPIAASLTFDTATGLGNSDLSITMSDPFLGTPATFHSISMSQIAGTNLLDGNVLVDWGVNTDMSLHIEWDASGMFNAINYGLQVGDTISGTDLIRGGNVLADVGSAIPYSDTLLALNPLYLAQDGLQGAAPLAATSNSLGLGATTPFTGIRGYFDIGSGNSLHVTAVNAVPVPAAVWLFGSGLLALVGFARRRA